MSYDDGTKFKLAEKVYLVVSTKEQADIEEQTYVIVDAKPGCRIWYYSSPSALPLWRAFGKAKRKRKGLAYGNMKDILINNFTFDSPATMPEHLEEYVKKMLEYELIEETKLKPLEAQPAPHKKTPYKILQLLDNIPLQFKRDVPVTGGGKK